MTETNHQKGQSPHAAAEPSVPDRAEVEQAGVEHIAPQGAAADGAVSAVLADAGATAAAPGVDFGPRRSEASGPAASPGGYSRFVDAMKWVLPILAVVVFLAVIIVTSMQKEDDTFSVAIPTEQTETPEERMAAPEMTGFDDKGRPYNVTAERARRDEVDDSLIHLEQVTGWMLMDVLPDAGNAAADDAGDPDAESTQTADLFASSSINPEAQPENQLKISSHTGVLHSNDNLIDLSGDVVMTIGTTYKIATEAATINMHDKTAKSDLPTAVTLDWGTIDANSFTADSDAKTVVFTGNVHTTILPKSGLAPTPSTAKE